MYDAFLLKCFEGTIQRNAVNGIKVLFDVLLRHRFATRQKHVQQVFCGVGVDEAADHYQNECAYTRTFLLQRYTFRGRNSTAKYCMAAPNTLFNKSLTNN